MEKSPSEGREYLGPRNRKRAGPQRRGMDSLGGPRRYPAPKYPEPTKLLIGFQSSPRWRLRAHALPTSAEVRRQTQYKSPPEESKVAYLREGVHCFRLGRTLVSPRVSFYLLPPSPAVYLLDGFPQLRRRVSRPPRSLFYIYIRSPSLLVVFFFSSFSFFLLVFAPSTRTRVPQLLFRVRRVARPLARFRPLSFETRARARRGGGKKSNSLAVFSIVARSRLRGLLALSTANLTAGVPTIRPSSASGDAETRGCGADKVRTPVASCARTPPPPPKARAN